jgi:hypothetical protein
LHVVPAKAGTQVIGIATTFEVVGKLENLGSRLRGNDE